MGCCLHHSMKQLLSKLPTTFFVRLPDNLPFLYAVVWIWSVTQRPMLRTWTAEWPWWEAREAGGGLAWESSMGRHPRQGRWDPSSSSPSFLAEVYSSALPCTLSPHAALTCAQKQWGQLIMDWSL